MSRYDEKRPAPEDEHHHEIVGQHDASMENMKSDNPPKNRAFASSSFM